MASECFMGLDTKSGHIHAQSGKLSPGKISPPKFSDRSNHYVVHDESEGDDDEGDDDDDCYDDIIINPEDIPKDFGFDEGIKQRTRSDSFDDSLESTDEGILTTIYSDDYYNI